MALQSIFGISVGDTIRIVQMNDPYIPIGSYNGREGVVEHIDDAGNLHGTWGGLAIIPGVDSVQVIRRAGL